MPRIPKLKTVKVRALIRELFKFPPDADVLLSSDEELNTLFRDVQVAQLGKPEQKQVVLWGNSGSETDDGNIEASINEEVFRRNPKAKTDKAEFDKELLKMIKEND